MKKFSYNYYCPDQPCPYGARHPRDRTVYLVGSKECKRCGYSSLMGYWEIWCHYDEDPNPIYKSHEEIREE